MQDTVFIIPGFWGIPSEKIYKDISKLYSEHGIKPIVVNIPWKRKVMSDYSSYFMYFYNAHKNGKTHLFGWSFGAMIAYIAASQIEVETMVLCSTSPYWKEQLVK